MIVLATGSGLLIAIEGPLAMVSGMHSPRAILRVIAICRTEKVAIGWLLRTEPDGRRRTGALVAQVG